MTYSEPENRYTESGDRSENAENNNTLTISAIGTGNQRWRPIG